MKLYDILKQYREIGRLPYHMPGHKRNPAFSEISPASHADFTEVDGLDDLRAPTGILAEAEKRAADVWGANKTHFLVNGATGGILASVYALCRGRHIVMARNCHKSVYNAATISNCTTSYIIPKTSPLGYFLDVTPAEVEKTLDSHPNTAAVIITSPTYEGVVSDIRSIAEVCHAHGALLIVDAAHGAHLGFLDESIPSPAREGADVVIMSLHKTLPSLTQTALLHVLGERASQDMIASAIAMFETSSPSYVFMASIDSCTHLMSKRKMFESWRENIEKIRKIGISRGIISTPKDVFAYDKSKIVISSHGMSGDMIARHLRNEYNIEVEMISENYVILMTGAGDTDEMTSTLCRALLEFPASEKMSEAVQKSYILPEAVMTMAEATACDSEIQTVSKCEGMISAESVMAYPPGIPIVAPGEIIGFDTISTITSLSASGVRLVTSRGSYDGKIKVVKLDK